MRRRRGRILAKRGLLILIVALALVYLHSKFKPPEEIITKLCHEDQDLFRRELNVSLSCDCGQFQFLPSCTRLENFVFSMGDRHKNILFLSLKETSQRVVLKYRKDTTQLKRPLVPSTGQFNGQPHFCPNSFELFQSKVEWAEDDIFLLATMNFEVVFLKFLRFSILPVPKFIGNCGLYLMESYGGATLDSFYKSDVKQRLTIAKNILIGGLSLTSGFEGLRIYLTDATRDNIAVDEETLEVTFIDLDDVIIQKTDLKEDIHRHRRIECDNCFAYSTDAICGASISDINIYTICQLLLEDLRGRHRGGFLYLDDRQLKSFSSGWRHRWDNLLKLLRSCVYCDNQKEHCTDRFELAHELVGELHLLILGE